MNLLFIAILIIVLAGAASAVVSRYRSALANDLGLVLFSLGCVLGVLASVRLLLAPTTGATSSVGSVFLGATAHFSADSLSAFFLVVIFSLSLLFGVYAKGYVKACDENEIPWLLFAVLCASMALVVISADAVSFLVAWELMALSSFLLVAHEREKRNVPRAAWLYLGFTHLGTAALVVFFLIMGQLAGGYQFSQFVSLPVGGAGTLLLVLAVIGFGSKAGLMPLHIWLPEAHPAAPSYVSALMSGVMIKTGIYGLLRTITFLGVPHPAWGWALIALGCLSGVGGVLLAIAQHDIKRLLAYHSVENIGIILIAIGLGCVGLSNGSPELAVLGFAAGLLHTLNHAVFKGLLFLSAGAVIARTRTRSIDAMGGLFKTMPLTGVFFLVGAISICGLPPFNGFVSEFLIYISAFARVGAGGRLTALPYVLPVLSLASIGGLALLCFTKAFGIIFLGEPRTPSVATAGGEDRWMTVPMGALAALCAAIGVVPSLVTGLLTSPAAQLADTANAARGAARLHSLLATLGHCALGIVAVLAAGWGVRMLLARGKKTRTTVTWDCGFVRPSRRLQYTASSFAASMVDTVAPVLGVEKHLSQLSGYFPAAGHFESHAHDLASRALFQPLYRRLGRLLRWCVRGLGCEDGLVSASHRLLKRLLRQIVFRLLSLEDQVVASCYGLARRGLRAVTAIQNGDSRAYLLYLLVALCAVLVAARGLS